MNSTNSNSGIATSTTGAKRKIRIYKPHTHEGKRLTPGPDGIEIEVNEPDAKFLDSIGVTKRPDAIAEVAPAATAGGIRPQG
jgi:hypothetical protein